ncbi:MAG TPA: nucleoside-diphosphate sugar epimerase/dehydratase [Thiobacillaceae bacterium]|nr:nucleoside-diphosphate sugar epimerase/dehydratase [Thiobacillaceae bacterium]
MRYPKGAPSSRSLLVLAYDTLASLAAWVAAYWLRFNMQLPPEYLPGLLDTVLWVVPLQTLIFWRFGLYRGIWRFASLPDLRRILIAVGVVALATPAALILFRIQAIVPRSVLLLDPLLLILIMGGSRLMYRLWKEHRLTGLLSRDRQSVLVAGAGSAADVLLRELKRSPSRWRVEGLFDDDEGKIGRRMQDIPVLGRLADLPRYARHMDVRDVILALPSAQHAVRRQWTETFTAAGLNVLTVPSLEDLMNGRVAISSLRPIQLDDLLGRDPVKLDDAGLSQCLGNAVILVTGAGGSIGSELCRQIAHFRPACLVMLEQSEYALYCMEQEFARRMPELRVVSVIGDVKDARRLDEIMSAHRPSVVFHAAAYKHVPLMEQENALQALKNNVLGTFVLARAARAAGVHKFVMVSTDKAVNPTNVMGASKRLAEMVCQVLRPRGGGPADQADSGGTRFISVRFGNVLGSSGSVIPKFQQQIESGGPVTVTHPEITRFFMSIPEAAQLVLQAGLMGEGGEIFVLDMGEPIRIADLARLMIKLAGKTEDEIEIVYSGLRPGEKLYEELLADEETTLPTPHPKLRVARARAVDETQLRAILDWIEGTAGSSDDQVRARLREWLPEYRPSEAPSGLLQIPLDGLGRRESLGDGGGYAGLGAVGHVAGGVETGH